MRSTPPPLVFFFNDTAPTEIYTLSLHDALPIYVDLRGPRGQIRLLARASNNIAKHAIDRKSTRLNSSHMSISYAVFCLKKKKACRQWTVSWHRARARRRGDGRADKRV